MVSLVYQRVSPETGHRDPIPVIALRPSRRRAPAPRAAPSFSRLVAKHDRRVTEDGKDTPETPWKNISKSSRTSSKSHPPIYLVKNSHWIIPNDVFFHPRAFYHGFGHGNNPIISQSWFLDSTSCRSWQVVSENGGLVGGLEPWNFIFTYIGNNHPNWRTPSFFRGVGRNHQPEDVSPFEHAHFWMGWRSTSGFPGSHQFSGTKPIVLSGGFQRKIGLYPPKIIQIWSLFMLKVGFWGPPFSETSALTQVKAKVFAGWGLGNDENPWDEDLEIIGYQATITVSEAPKRAKLVRL